MRTWRQFVAEMPVAGYLLKICHDIVKLPIVRRDLHNEILLLQRTLLEHEVEAAGMNADVARQTIKTERIEQHFSSILDHMSAAAAAIHSLQESGRLMQEQINAAQDQGISPLQAQVRALQDHMETFPATLRQTRRSAEGVVRRMDDLSNRIGTLASAEQIENTEKQLRQTFESLAERVAQQRATIHTLEERVKSMQERLAVTGNGAIKQTGNSSD